MARTEAIRADLAGTGYTLAQAALKFVLAHPAVSTVIPGIRNVAQAEANCGVSDLPPCPPPCWKNSTATTGAARSGTAASEHGCRTV